MKVYIVCEKYRFRTWIASPNMKNFPIKFGTAQSIYRLWTSFCTMGSVGVRLWIYTPRPKKLSNLKYTIPGPICNVNKRYTGICIINKSNSDSLLFRFFKKREWTRGGTKTTDSAELVSIFMSKLSVPCRQCVCFFVFYQSLGK